MRIHEDVLLTAEIIAENPLAGEQAFVDRLLERGYDRLRAELLVGFVPLGLGRAVITEMHTSPALKLSDTALIQDYRANRLFKIRLADVPEFEIARELAWNGEIPAELFVAASRYSVELNLIGQALSAGQNIGGGILAAPILLRIAEVTGFEEWYQEITGDDEKG